MPIKSPTRLARKPVGAKGVARATALRTTPTGTRSKDAKEISAKGKSAKPKSAKLTLTKTKPVKPKPDKAAPEKTTPKEMEKRPRAKVTKELPDNICVDPDDTVAVAAVMHAKEKSATGSRVSNRRSAVDRLSDPPPDQESSATLLARVSTAIERELSQIEIIVADGHARPAQRTSAESRARVLASLARTLKDVLHLREHQAGAEDERAKAADDDAVPRDLDEFRRELSRRLERMVAGGAPLPDGGNE